VSAAGQLSDVERAAAELRRIADRIEAGEPLGFICLKFDHSGNNEIAFSMVNPGDPYRAKYWLEHLGEQLVQQMLSNTARGSSRIVIAGADALRRQ